MSIHKRKSKNNKQKQSSPQSIDKQKLTDLQRKMSINVGTLLVLIEEGTPEQVAMTGQTTKMDLLKYGPEMIKTAQTMGEPYTEAVENYLDSIDQIAHTATGWIDEEKISNCYVATDELESLLRN
jgi:hypothetical protein